MPLLSLRVCVGHRRVIWPVSLGEAPVYKVVAQLAE
jgi:hypothetical protein